MLLDMSESKEEKRMELDEMKTECKETGRQTGMDTSVDTSTAKAT